jgi:hypothetical protein
MLNESECAFGRHGNDVCSDPKTLTLMTKIIGALVSDPKQIVEQAKKKLQCDSEACIIESNKFRTIAGEDVAKEALLKNFKPAGPKTSKEWLSNVDIDHVLHQWSELFPTFLHLPFQMRDFADKNDILSKISLVDYARKGRRSWGVVINTDISSGRGIHWFCLYGELNPPSEGPCTIEYYNSSGRPPLMEIQEWIERTAAQLTEYNPKVEIIKANLGVQHQKSNSECGNFSLFYIYSRLMKVPFGHFAQLHVCDDEMMYKFRRHIFRSLPKDRISISDALYDNIKNKLLN